MFIIVIKINSINTIYTYAEINTHRHTHTYTYTISLKMRETATGRHVFRVRYPKASRAKHSAN